MHITTSVFRLTALSAALLAVFGPAQADDERDALMKPQSSVSVGIGNWSGDRYQQGMYDGMREGQAYGLIDADIVRLDADNGTWWKLDVRNLGIDGSEKIRGEYLRQGDVGISLGFKRITRDNPNTFNTSLQTSNGGATQVQGHGSLLKHTVRPSSERQISTLGLYKNLMPGLDFQLDFKNEEKTGWRSSGLRPSSGLSPTFLLEPIDSTTRQVDAVLNYTAEKLQLSGGYYGSWYRTRRDMVTHANRLADGSLSGTTYFTQPLDNQAHQIYLNGGYNFTSSTRATFKLAYTRATQDDRLPTQGLGISVDGSPSRLDGRVDTKLFQLGLTSRPTKELSLLANLRYEDVDDKTPTSRFIQVNPACGVNQCMNYMPVSNETLTAKLEASYRLPSDYRVTLGVDERQQDRKVSVVDGAGGPDAQRVVPMRKDVDETTWRLELRKSLSEVLNGSLSYLYSERSGSSWVRANSTYNTDNQGFAQFSNRISPLNIADRDRNKVRLALDWMPLENLSLQFNIEDGRDKYEHDDSYDAAVADTRPFGLHKGTTRLYSLDAAYVLSDTWRLNGWYSYDQSKARQRNARAANGGGSPAILDTALEDVGHSFGLGVRGEAMSQLKVGADLEWTRSTSKYDQRVSLLPGGSTLLPANFSGDLSDIDSRLFRVSVFSSYVIDDSAEVRVDFIHERWKTNDWTWSLADGSPFSYADGTYVSVKPKQTANFIAVRYIYTFR
ncbi:MtrB/PioB family decaheme-associated outer membrane protein [Thauera linaloolentis]|uniref:MtrB/PioB family decaheme-associated outer membrane protein n=1 Tax=Thauera linaloolentis (strain DSM 12138 / JCM 21573 / CCUG 41526 / CIP 105981 / IAM 15112 / NBRC 102519 / 47Lol) TaxID=1123367 RepID=N6YXM0_THAL4|nr:MtrB/PioB family decaheme-associated outer membrane protein [Thauera linaloolentis]ENO87157.1 hypothetical protein C666_11635 [Thauera linaloolentis 47Lol = DSM 12138]MCM8566424.1 MtrB/PioB family decaheme-associated outer membrane protein [Thauera linaloolentis]